MSGPTEISPRAPSPGEPTSVTAALMMSFGLWALMTAVFSAFNPGGAPGRTAIGAAVAVGAGYLAWSIYRRVSQRHDGLAILLVGSSVNIVGLEREVNLSLGQVVTRHLFLGVVLVLFSFLMARFVDRWTRIKKKGMKPPSTLWDATLDRPADRG